MAGKKITMADIALELDLSINAVSLALNDRAGVSEDTRRKILNKAEELGYLELNKKYAATYSNRNICILLEHRFFSDMHFYGKVLLGLESEAKDAGYDVLIHSFERHSQETPGCVEKGKVSGIVIIGKIEDAFLIKLKKYRIPIVLIDWISLEESMDCVITDNKLGNFKMTKYLIDQGFQKIGFVGEFAYSPSVRERFWGFQEALQVYMGMDFEKSMEYIKRYSMLNEIEKYVMHNDSKALAEGFQTIPEVPEALMCSNDRAAILMCKALEGLGYKVPQDISVVGFDDIELCKMVTPRITTVHVNKELMGKRGMQKLIYRLEHPEDKIEKIIMDVRIVERDSVRSRAADGDAKEQKL